MDLGISGKVALVTAASRGLERGCAEQLAQHRAEQENKTKEQVIQEMMSANPSNSIGDPSDFGAAAAFLAGAQARYITGQNLLVDGGSYRGLL